MAFSDPAYLAAVVDLLGAIAYGEMSAFERLSRGRQDGARRCADKVELARMAATEFAHFERLCDHGSPSWARTRSRRWRRSSTPFDAFHRRTAPADWLEGLVKAYVGDGLAADFYREIAAFLDADTRTMIVESLARRRPVRVRRRPGARRDRGRPRIGGRLALWGRRLMGEALTQAQRVAAERDALTRAARRRRRPARAWTWPRSAGCSPG